MIKYPKAYLLLLVLICLCSVSFQTAKNVLLWNELRPLTWDDFNGKPEKRFAAASTHYDILKSIKKENKLLAFVKIEAVFFRNTSWKKKSWINDEVLAHEQKHFDIVELFARKMRKVIKESKFKNYEELEEKVESVYKQYDDDMDAYQDKYDDETDGSMNGNQQRAWQKKILKEIEELNSYKETTIKISFP